MNLKLLRTILLSTAVTGSLCASAFALGTDNTLVTSDAINLSPTPPAITSVASVTPKGSLVVVGSMPGYSWYKDVYLGTAVYFDSDNSSVSGDSEDSFGSGKIIGTQVCMFDAADLNANLIGSYSEGTEMQVLAVSDSWYKVKYGSVIGFVSSEDFSLDSKSEDATAKCLSAGDEVSLRDDVSLSEDTAVNLDLTLGQQIVDTAEKYLGTPYVWGGTTTRGFDCSGFVQYVYRECGYTINRTAAAIYKEGTYVDKSELQVGDAICFASHTESVGHVGIYIGNGQFIHASSGAGHVIISDLDMTYYATHYVGARHIV